MQCIVGSLVYIPCLFLQWRSQMHPEEVLGWVESIRKRWRWNDDVGVFSPYFVDFITININKMSQPSQPSLKSFHHHVNMIFSMSFHHMFPFFSMVFTIFLVFLIFLWFSHGFPMFFPDAAPSAPDSCRTRGASAWSLTRKPVIRWRPTRLLMMVGDGWWWLVMVDDNDD